MRIKKTFAAAVAILYFTQNIALLSATETNVWAERRKAMYAALPAAAPALNLPFQNSALSDVSSKLAPSTAGVPQWMQAAIAPYATINAVAVSKNPAAKTVVILQDIHLNYEAQTNIAGVLDGMGRALAEKQSKLLVGLESTSAPVIRFDEFNAIAQRKSLRRVAEAFIKHHIFKGSELAAVGYQGNGNNGPVELPFIFTGLENQASYDANGKAFKDSVPLRKNAEEALNDLSRTLTDLKVKIFNADLLAFDAKAAAYETEALSLPEYAAYLDSIQAATTPNIRKLVQATLMEHTLDFDKVERERDQMLQLLVGRLKDSEIKELLSFSTLFKAGQVSYGSYFEHLKTLAEKHDVSLRKYTEMSLYIQYVLKTESINHTELFTELRQLEEKVGDQLAVTKDQKELLSLQKDYFLLQKLSQHMLIEDEWKSVEKRESDILRLSERLAALGGSMPRSAQKMAGQWKTFADFYRWAIKRNDDIAGNLSERLAKLDTKTAVLIAGGFHANGLEHNLIQQGFTVITASPKLTQIEKDALSSLDVLASGRLPIDQLFVGEKLFYDVTPTVGGPNGPMAAAAARVATRQVEDPSANPVKETVAGIEVSAEVKEGEPAEGSVDVPLDDGRHVDVSAKKPEAWNGVDIAQLLFNNISDLELLQDVLRNAANYLLRNRARVGSAVAMAAAIEDMVQSIGALRFAGSHAGRSLQIGAVVRRLATYPSLFNVLVDTAPADKKMVQKPLLDFLLMLAGVEESPDNAQQALLQQEVDEIRNNLGITEPIEVRLLSSEIPGLAFSFVHTVEGQRTRVIYVSEQELVRIRENHSEDLRRQAANAYVSGGLPNAAFEELAQHKFLTHEVVHLVADVSEEDLDLFHLGKVWKLVVGQDARNKALFTREGIEAQARTLIAGYNNRRGTLVEREDFAVELPGASTALAVDPTGRFAAVATVKADRTQEITIFDGPSGQEYDHFIFSQINAPITQLAIDPEGKVLAIGTEKGFVFYGISNRVFQAQIPNTSPITSFAFHPSASWVFVGDADGVIRVFNVWNNHEIANIDTQTDQPITSMNISLDGNTLLTTEGLGFTRWSVALNELTPGIEILLTKELSVGVHEPVEKVQLLDDGKSFLYITASGAHVHGEAEEIPSVYLYRNRVVAKDPQARILVPSSDLSEPRAYVVAQMAVSSDGNFALATTHGAHGRFDKPKARYFQLPAFIRPSVIYMSWPRFIAVMALIDVLAGLTLLAVGSDAGFSVATYFAAGLVTMVIAKETTHRLIAGQDYKAGRDRVVRGLLRLAQRSISAEDQDEVIRNYLEQAIARGDIFFRSTRRFNSFVLEANLRINELRGHLDGQRSPAHEQSFMDWMAGRFDFATYQPRFSFHELGVVHANPSPLNVFWGEAAFFTIGFAGIVTFYGFVLPFSPIYMGMAFLVLIAATFANPQMMRAMGVTSLATRTVTTVRNRIYQPATPAQPRPMTSPRPAPVPPVSVAQPAAPLTPYQYTLGYWTKLKNQQREIVESPLPVQVQAERLRSMLLALSLIAGEGAEGRAYALTVYGRLRIVYPEDFSERATESVEHYQRLFETALDAQKSFAEGARFPYIIDAAYDRYSISGQTFLLACTLAAHRDGLPANYFVTDNEVVQRVGNLSLGADDATLRSFIEESEIESSFKPGEVEPEDNLVKQQFRRGPLIRPAVEDRQPAASVGTELVAFFGDEVAARIPGLLLARMLNNLGDDPANLAINEGKLYRELSAFGELFRLVPSYEIFRRWLGTKNKFAAITQFLWPQLALVPNLADRVVELAQFIKNQSMSDALNADLQELVQAHFTLNENVAIEVVFYDSNAEEFNNQFAFMQKVETSEGAKFTIRIDQRTYNRIMQETSTGLIERARVIGVALSKTEAAALARQFFLLREIGRGVLGFSDDQLVDIGLADEARLAAKRNGGIRVAEIFVTAADIVGEMENMNPTEPVYGSLKNPAEARAARTENKLITGADHFPAVRLLKTEALKWRESQRRYTAKYDESQLVFNEDGHLLASSFVKLTTGPEESRPRNARQEIHRLERAGYAHQVGGLQETVAVTAGKLPIINPATSNNTVWSHVMELDRSTPADQPMTLATLTDIQTFNARFDEAPEEVKNMLERRGASFRVITLAGYEGREEAFNPVTGDIQKSALLYLINQFKVGGTLSDAFILANRTFTIDGMDAALAGIQLFLAVDVQVQDLHGRLRVEQIVFTQA